MRPLVPFCIKLIALAGCQYVHKPVKPPPGKTIDVVCDVVAELMSVDRKQVTPQTKCLGDLKGDDLDMVEMVMEIEVQLNISISDEAMENLAGKFGESPQDFTLQQFADLADQLRKK